MHAKCKETFLQYANTFKVNIFATKQYKTRRGKQDQKIRPRQK